MTLSFSKPVAVQGSISNVLWLEDSLGRRRSPQNVVTMAQGRQLEAAFGVLPSDSYRVNLNLASVADQAGNSAGSTNVSLAFVVGPLTRYQYNLRWAGQTWTNGNVDWHSPNRLPTGGLWNVASNWVKWVGQVGDDWDARTNWVMAGRTPGTNDNVFIGPTQGVSYNDRLVAYVSDVPVLTVSNFVCGAPFGFSFYGVTNPPFATLQVPGTLVLNDNFDFEGSNNISSTVLLGGPRGLIREFLGNMKTFDNVTFAGTVNFDNNFNFQLANTLTLHGTVHRFAPFQSGNNNVLIQGEGTLQDCHFFCSSNSSLTFGSNVTQRGYCILSLSDTCTITNRGTIVADQKYVPANNTTFAFIGFDQNNVRPVANTNSGLFVNDGSLEIQSGGYLFLDDSEQPNWRNYPLNFINLGSLHVDEGGKLALFGLRWASTQIDAESNAVVSMGGALVTEPNQTALLCGPATWLVYGYSGNYSSFNGGTVTLTNGAVLKGSIALSNLTFNGNIELTQVYIGDPSWPIQNNHFLDLFGNVSINGNIKLGDDAGQFYAQLRVYGGSQDPQGHISNAINGQAVVSFGNNPANAVMPFTGTDPVTLTVGSGVTLRGGVFTIGYVQYNSPNTVSLVTRGSLEAASPGGAITLTTGFSSLAGTWTNEGSVLAQPGSKLNLSSIGSFNNGSILAVGAAINVNGWLTNAGTIHLDAHSLMSATNGYAQTDSGRLQLDLAGLAAGVSYSQLRILGPTVLGGQLDVSLTESFVPKSGDAFDILTWASQTGSFGSLNLPALGAGLTLKPSYQANGLRLTAGP